MNVYESIPTMEKGEIRLRPVTAADEAALLRVYGDPLALPFFNSDNCHGDIFYYDTPEKMRRAMDFWRTSWEKGWFVRWAIERRGEVIGTVELCRRAGVKFTPAGSTWPYGRDPQDSNIRIAPSFASAEEIEPAARLFSICVRLATLEKLAATRFASETALGAERIA